MATYTELFDLQRNDALRNRVTVACTIAAETIRAENPATANHANRLKWAKGVFENPGGEGAKMLMALLASNNALTVAQITNATDAAIQTGVNTAVDVFAQG